MICNKMAKFHKNQELIVYLCLLFLIFNTFLAAFSQSTSNKITQGQVLKDGEIMTSQNQDYAFGFFSPINSSSRYVGIWYNKVSVQTVIWVANRDAPLSDTSGSLSFGTDGNLKLSVGNDSSSSNLWSTNSSSLSTNSTVILMDTGNLALCKSDETDENCKALWQSFSNPTDSFLPDMRVYTMSQTVKQDVFTSWRSPSDPNVGNYSMAFDPRGSPQIVLWEGLNKRLWRSGHWNGLIFLGVPNARARYLSGFQLTSEGNGDMYFTYTASNKSIFTRFTIMWNGVVQQSTWDEGGKVWNMVLSQPSDDCGNYNRCGDFGVCSVKGSSGTCDCVKGFVPRFEDEWRKGNWSGGCIRRNALKCDTKNGTNDGFLEVEGVKLPDFADVIGAGNAGECQDKCLNNCSCTGYGYVLGIGCMIWSGELIDIEHIAGGGGGGTLYVRVADSELGSKRKMSNIAIIIVAVVAAIILVVIFLAIWRYREKLKAAAIRKPWQKQVSLLTDVNRSQDTSLGFSGNDDLSIEGKPINGPQLPLFSFHFIEQATASFANKNKLGQGGFGPVYKGVLPGGEEVAVKRLSKWSGQGMEEFKTEMILIAKLQHRNLVRLLGCCIEGEEKLLVYEYMPNKSLDSFLFDPAKKARLDWNTRFSIIEGVARGLLYLHRDSRLRIIHRDLKASNILLDEEMTPKISDFGMARIFGGNQNEANTVRVVGTYGYMSPEYAMEGLFSVKSDVYSFGVLLLEIVSGQRNNTSHSPECTNLIRYAWNLWKDGKTEELIDPVIADSCPRDIVLQCIHVGMLCVQISAGHRPTMSSVLLMLESENSSLPMPRQPDITSLSSTEMDIIMRDHDIMSSTEVSVTQVSGR